MRIRVFCVTAAMIMGLAFTPEVLSAGEKKEEIKVSALLEEVNKIMAEAQDVYVDGDGDKAVELYRKALGEIKKIEIRYPDRVTSSEFAPLRFRRALCETEIDRILLEQVSIASRSVAVTDTRELEKKRIKRKNEAATNRFAKISTKLNSKTGSGIIESKTVEADKESREAKDGVAKRVEEGSRSADNTKLDIAVELDWVADMLAMEKFDEAERSLIRVLRADPPNFKGRYLLALVHARQNKLTDAQIIIEDLVTDYADNESVLLLASGLYTALQRYPKAMATLDRALKLAPKRPEGYLNMAWLLLQMNPGKLDDPEMYYRRSVELGGQRDFELEQRLGIRRK
jgi:tetratricopeptide (TPR) repeat protein